MGSRWTCPELPYTSKYVCRFTAATGKSIAAAASEKKGRERERRRALEGREARPDLVMEKLHSQRD